MQAALIRLALCSRSQLGTSSQIGLKASTLAISWLQKIEKKTDSRRLEAALSEWGVLPKYKGNEHI